MRISDWSSDVCSSDLGLLHRAGPLCLAFLMVACASQDSTAPLGYDEARAKHPFSEGYQDVSDIYIEEVAVSDLQVSGLSSLANIDPSPRLRRAGDRPPAPTPRRLMPPHPRPAPHDTQ